LTDGHLKVKDSGLIFVLMTTSTLVGVACLLAFVGGGGVDVDVDEPTGGAVTWSTSRLVMESVMLMGGPA
jgi:hypothetical protein